MAVNVFGEWWKVSYVEVLLQSYITLKDSMDVEIKDFMMDLERAIQKSELTITEKQVVKSLYLDDPISPQRSSGNGRPSGGSTHTRLGLSIFPECISPDAARKRFERTKSRAIYKISEQLQYLPKDM